MAEFKLKINFIQMTLLLVLLSCCRVDCWNGYRINFFNLYTRNNTDSPTVFRLSDVPKVTYSCEKYYFLVPGWRRYPSQKEFQDMKTELLKKEDANVIIVNWAHWANYIIYSWSANYTPKVGFFLARLFEMIRARKPNAHLWCIGHSLGAHICGYAGKGYKINQITGVDPAAPGFSSTNGLNPSDADFVQIIHTTFMVGFYSKLGHADFYPNGGKYQPDCIFLDVDCHHTKGLHYFTESINKRCFKARKCTVSLTKITCTHCTDCGYVPHMGYDANPKLSGDFYLKTWGNSSNC